MYISTHTRAISLAQVEPTMTYCVAARVDEGLVFLADTRVTAGFDQVNTFRKLHVFERAGDRAMVLLVAGNLGLCQAILNILATESADDPNSIWAVSRMFDVAHRVGQAVRLVFDDFAPTLRAQGLAFNVDLILGGQIAGGECSLFQIYPAGNFVEAMPDSPYVEIGASKQATPLLNQLLRHSSPLTHAAKCALLAMDWTLRTNLSVGMPLDMLVYKAGTLAIDEYVNIESTNHAFEGFRKSWDQELLKAVDQVSNPLQWVFHAVCAPDTPAHLPLRIQPACSKHQRALTAASPAADNPSFARGRVRVRSDYARVLSIVRMTGTEPQYFGPQAWSW